LQHLRPEPGGTEPIIRKVGGLVEAEMFQQP
jgi:hypothetical protein